MTVQLFGSHGFRLDVDFGLRSLLRDRYAMFLKVYSHPVKLAAGAMLGKALAAAMKTGLDAFQETEIEQMGDEELVLKLRDSGPSVSKNLARQLLDRQLYEPVYRSRAIQGQVSDQKYWSCMNSYRERGWFDPTERAALEASIASDVALNPDDVIFYFPPKAPGAQKAVFSVEEEAGRVSVRGEHDDAHRQTLDQHLQLWNVYVFASPSLSRSERDALGQAAQERVGLVNENAVELRRLINRR